VSREIKTLEDQLGQPLFSRVNRGLQLTEPGQVLYRAVGEALSLIEEATSRLAGAKAVETLTVTTSVPLASTWLVPKLPRFLRRYPEIDVRSVAADQRLDLQRERLDIAIRWAPPGSIVPDGERLFDVEIFPVCAPATARDSKRPVKSPDDLARHVLLDLETFTHKGRWSDWQPWLEAMKMLKLKPAGTLRFSHYDQVIQAAIDGSGIAIGRTPHNARHLRDGSLVAPLGKAGAIPWGNYFVLIAPSSAQRPIVKKFVAWLHEEVREDAARPRKGKSAHRKSRFARA
jgi:DNA-binding transcriptional LysR family regulator